MDDSMGILLPSIPQCFEAHVAAAPDHWAIKTPHRSLTYHELNALANQIAWAVLARYGDASAPVALLLSEGVPLIAALLGVLKAGKFFVPLDPVHPEARTRSVLVDAAPCVLLTDTVHVADASALASGVCPVLNLDTVETPATTTNPALPLTADTLATLSYTSGSTGQPKGVLIDHGPWVHDLCYGNAFMQISATDRLALLAAGTTAAMRTTLRGLVHGATLYPYPVREVGMAQLTAWLQREAITIYQSGPALFRQWLATLRGHEPFPALRLIRMGSAPLLQRDVELYQQRLPEHCALVNVLASTETGTFRLYFLDHHTQLVGDTVPVGYAVPGQDVLLLDEAGQAVGPHEVGEIVIRSAYLARGYWRQPELTQAVFQPDAHDPRLRLYHTGDLGFLRPDGCLEYRGRQDTQVKVRGYRVELSEIEQALCRYPSIQEAVVLARLDDTGERRLVAYVVPTQLPPPTVNALLQWVGTRLPSYMLPTAFVFLEALPLLPTGKLDRQALPPPATTRPALAQPYVAPRTPVETALARVWAEVLGLENVGVDDDFLALGGHSLLATQVLTRVQEAWHVDIPLRDLLEASTVARMAVLIVHCLLVVSSAATALGLLEEIEALPEAPR